LSLAAQGRARASALAAQRRGLPDQPGVYLFRDERGKVIYVGKAVSIRKRVASHFSKAQGGRGIGSSSPGHAEMVASVASVECVVVASEAEALLTEQGFIKQYRPRFNIRLRDDKSYPFIAISLDEPFPRVYFTRERHRPGRAYFGPYSNAKRVRATLEVLAKVFMFRSCNGTEPGRRSGSPCLDYYIKRCSAPCVGYVSREEYRASIDQVMDFLSGHFVSIERDIEARMKAAAAAEEFEQATLERNRLRAVRSLLERRRVAGAAAGTFDAVAVAIDGTDANAQVFQIRDGILTDRQSFYLANETERGVAEVAEEFMLQYYSGHLSIPALIVVQRESCDQDGVDSQPLADALASRREGPVEIRPAERGEKRRMLELAERNALLALDTERLRAERRRQSRVDALDGLQQALGLDAPPIRIECYDISHLGGTQTVASMVVFEGGAPKKSDYRRFRVRSLPTGASDDYAAMAEVLQRRCSRWEAQSDLSPHDPSYDASFATLPSLVVIDGGPGQLAAGLRPLAGSGMLAGSGTRAKRVSTGPAKGVFPESVGFSERGVAVISLAKRIEEVFMPGRKSPLVLDHSTPELQLLQRVRDEAHRFAITHHRARRDRAMTGSLLDDLPGVGPARKRALLVYFGSPDAVAAASSEELQAVPGLPAKVGREIHSRLHRTG
jgi:excinuclease ABC subunit C